MDRLGIEQPDHHDGAKIVQNGDGGEKKPDGAASLPPREAQHGQGKGDIRCYGHRPATHLGCVCMGKREINQGGQDHAPECRDRRPCAALPSR